MPLEVLPSYFLVSSSPLVTVMSICLGFLAGSIVKVPDADFPPSSKVNLLPSKVSCAFLSPFEPVQVPWTAFLSPPPPFSLPSPVLAKWVKPAKINAVTSNADVFQCMVVLEKKDGVVSLGDYRDSN